MFNVVSQEHRMVSETVQRLFKDLKAADTEKRQRNGSRIDSAVVGQALQDLGLFGTSSDEAFMVSPQVQAIVALEAGASALPFPVLEALATHATMLNVGYTADADSGGIITLSTASPELSELPVFEGGRLSGSCLLVPFPQVAGRALIEARQEMGSVLLVVDLGNPGVTRRKRESVETDYCLDDLTFDQVAALPLIGAVASTSNSSAILRQRVALLAAAEIAGACRSMVKMTQEYLLTRSQFGQVLGANQVLKHAIADNLVSVEAMTASIEFAAAALDAGECDADAAVCAAKLYAGRAGKAVADSSLQLHGAIGYTNEYHLHTLMRRVYRLAASCGSGRVQSERLFEFFKQGVLND